MKIIATPQYAVNIMLGVFGGNSFYEKFDKEVFKKKSWCLEEWKDNKEELCSLVNKIQARWKRDNLKKFVGKLFTNKNMQLLEKFFEAKKNFNGDYEAVKEKITDIVESTQNIGHIQNTRVSKILHILAPNLIPMMDPEQGNFILGNGEYDKTDRKHLIEVFKKFHKAFANEDNKNKIKQIDEQLKKHKIEITELRIFELLIWLQTQYNIKKIDIRLVE